MIAKPSTPQLLQTMKTELAEKIMPALTDPTHVVAVQMMTAILDALSVRVENELGWMKEECAAIETAAAHYLSHHTDATALAAALAAYRADTTSSLKLSDASADYDRAGEVLSCLVDASFAGGTPAEVRAAEQLIEQRLATEMAILGTFVAAGRE